MSDEPLELTGAQAKLRVLIVDDHDVVHWGFRTMLGNQPWVERTLSARSGICVCRPSPLHRVTGSLRSRPSAPCARGFVYLVPRYPILSTPRSSAGNPYSPPPAPSRILNVHDGNREGLNRSRSADAAGIRSIATEPAVASARPSRAGTRPGVHAPHAMTVMAESWRRPSAVWMPETLPEPSRSVDAMVPRSGPRTMPRGPS